MYDNELANVIETESPPLRSCVTPSWTPPSETICIVSEDEFVIVNVTEYLVPDIVMDMLVPVLAIDTKSVISLTVMLHEYACLSSMVETVIIVVPLLMAVTFPFSSTEATDGLLLVHFSF